jgi:hypothetical protein
LIIVGPARAQQQRQTGFMVHQWSVCPGESVAIINQAAAVYTPVLEELRSEGMIRAWYDLRHAWGDEWNVGFVTVAESHRAWLDFWGEYVRRARQADPELFAQMSTLCTMHKDNFYSVRDSRTGG